MAEAFLKLHTIYILKEKSPFDDKSISVEVLLGLLLITTSEVIQLS